MKTGSTSIQTVLSSKSFACDNVNVHYPSGGRASFISLANSLYLRPLGKRADLEMRAILKQLNRVTSDVAVISAEQFGKVDPEVLRAAIETYMPHMLAEARFIAYVRPHAERIPSAYAEHVKIGTYHGTMAKFAAAQFKREAIVYTPRFQAWRDTFGEAFELRPMIREQLFRQDVVADFLQFALQTDDFTVGDVQDTNESLSLENLSIVRHMHARIVSDGKESHKYLGILGRNLARQMNKSAFRDGTKLRLHKELAALIQVQYADDAAALDAAFFKGTPMTDALIGSVAKAVDVEQSIRFEDHFSPREQFLITTLIDQAVVLIHANPEPLFDKLRSFFFAKSGAEDDLDDPLPSGPINAGKDQVGRALSGSGAAGNPGGNRPGRLGARKLQAGKGRGAGGRKPGRAQATPDEPV